MHIRTSWYLGLALAAASASSAQITELSSIQAAAERAVRQAIPLADRQVSVHVQSLDPRLRLAVCDRPLSTAIAGDGQPRVHATVKVLCEGNVRWAIYLSADIESDFKV